MLPDYPIIKGKLLEDANRYLRFLSRIDPVLSKIKIQHNFEGNKMATITDDGTEDISDYKELSGETSIDISELIEKGPSILIEHAKKFAEDMKKQQSELLFKKIGEVADNIGNTINAGGKLFSYDIFLETLNKIWIDFDEEGKPILPTMVVSPELGAKLRNILPEWEKNEEYKKQFSEVIDTKKKEWDARESDRKLVD